jgi:predicted DNA-binding transcriptional regulator AlpA
VRGLRVPQGVELVTVREISRRIGVSNGRAHQIINADRSFPAPFGVLAGRLVYDWRRVSAWASEAGRATDPTPPASVSYTAPIDVTIVTLSEVAAILAVSIPRAAELAAQDRFPPPIGRFGRAILWRIEEVTTWNRDIRSDRRHQRTHRRGAQWHRLPEAPPAPADDA